MGRGRRARGRNLTGILLLDKPIGCSSNAALQTVKRLYDARKAGHTGSLDPLATGLLPICFGHATKLSGYLLDADKSYWVRAKLGERTSTADAEGEIVESKAVPTLDEQGVNTVLAGFLGDQEQLPPMYSAVKHQGKRLYELARAGEEVERKPRSIRVHELELLSIDGDILEMRMRCSKGTYVRTLVEDIATALGTVAHVSALRRTAVGPFSGEDMISMEQLQALAKQEEGAQAALDKLLLPLSSALDHWPAVSLDANSSYYVQRGQAVQVAHAPTEGLVRIHDQDAEFIGVGEILDDGKVAPRRLLRD